MQNDISLEDVKKDTTLREERLQKMKNNIEALQMNMAKKKMMNKPSGNHKHEHKDIEPITITDQPSFESKPRSPINYQHVENEFGYNSTLFKNIQNDSQPIMNNGSAVSNFSSVSNINNILNNHHNFERVDYQAPSAPTKGKDNLLDDIDKILEKVQKSQKIPTKPLERILEQKESKPIRSIIPEEQLSSSKLSYNSGELSARNKLQEYKLLIDKLDSFDGRDNFKKIKEPAKSFQQEEKIISTKFGQQQFEEELQSYRIHHKGPSSLTVNSEYPISDNYSKMPPTPPPRHKKPSNAVQRQKMILKESVLQYKKLQTENSQEMLDRSEIDFDLSDDQDHQKPQKSLNSQKADKDKAYLALLKQKKELEQQLSQIEQQLQRLQREP